MEHQEFRARNPELIMIYRAQGDAGGCMGRLKKHVARLQLRSNLAASELGSHHFLANRCELQLPAGTGRMHAAIKHLTAKLGTKQAYRRPFTSACYLYNRRLSLLQDTEKRKLPKSHSQT